MDYIGTIKETMNFIISGRDTMTSEKLKQYISDHLDIAASYKSGIELDGCIDQAEYLWLKNGLFFTFFLDTFPHMGNRGPLHTSVHIDQLGRWGVCPLVTEDIYRGEYQAECISPDTAAEIIALCKNHQHEMPTVSNVANYLKYTANATPSVYLILDEDIKSHPTVIRNTIKGVYKECERNCRHELQLQKPHQWPISTKKNSTESCCRIIRNTSPELPPTSALTNT